MLHHGGMNLFEDFAQAVRKFHPDTASEIPTSLIPRCDPPMRCRRRNSGELAPADPRRARFCSIEQLQGGFPRCYKPPPRVARAQGGEGFDEVEAMDVIAQLFPLYPTPIGRPSPYVHQIEKIRAAPCPHAPGPSGNRRENSGRHPK